MIDRTHEQSVTRQAELVGISRGTVYYRPEPSPGVSGFLCLRRWRLVHGGGRRLRRTTAAVGKSG